MKFTALIVATGFIAFDILTGWLKSVYSRTTDSSVMRKGLFHKLAEIVAIMFGYGCELTFPLIGLQSVPLSGGISTYICLMETMSIVENLCVMNPQLADVLGKYFVKEKIDPDGKGGAHLENKSDDSD